MARPRAGAPGSPAPLGGGAEEPLDERVAPTRHEDLLPQPYRYIDGLVGEVVERALGAIDVLEGGRAAADAARRAAAAARGPSYGVSSSAAGDVRCCAASQGHLFVGNAAGELVAVQLATLGVVVRAAVHDGAPVDAIAASGAALRDVGGPTLIASASAAMVAVYAVDLERRALDLVAAGPPPQSFAAGAGADAGASGGAESIRAIEFAPDGRHLVLCGSRGSMVVLALPAPSTRSAAGALGAEPAADAAQSDAAEGATSAGASTPASAPAPALVLEVPPALALEHSGAASRRRTALGTAHAHLVLAQAAAPPRGDELGYPVLGSPPPHAAGVWVWWEGANALVLYAFGAVGAAAGKAPAPERSFVTPHEVTSSAMSADGATLATGMVDGTVLVWSTHLGMQEGRFGRLSAPARSVAFTTGANRAIVAAAADGAVRLHQHRAEGGASAGGMGVVAGRVDGPAGALQLLGDSSVAVVVAGEERLQLYDAAGGAVLLADIVPPAGMRFVAQGEGVCVLGPNSVAPGEPTLLMLARASAVDGGSDGGGSAAGDRASASEADGEGHAGEERAPPSEAAPSETEEGAPDGAQDGALSGACSVFVYELADYLPDTLGAEPPVMVERELHKPMLVPVPPSTAPGVTAGTQAGHRLGASVTDAPAPPPLPTQVLHARRRHLTTGSSRPATGASRPRASSNPSPLRIRTRLSDAPHGRCALGPEGVGAGGPAGGAFDALDPSQAIFGILQRLQGRRGGRHQRERRIARRTSELMRALAQEAAPV